MKPSKPYMVMISNVEKSNGDSIKGASIKLKNNTKYTDHTKTSNEFDSNIIINLSELGDWSIGDSLTIEVTYRNITKSKSHTIGLGDLGRFNFGEFSFLCSNKIISIVNIKKISGISNSKINSIGGILI